MEDRSNVLVRFWRGECSLAVSFWVFYVGPTLSARALFPLTRGIVEGQTFDPTRIFASVVGSFVLLSAVGLYQWVGLWRAARRTWAEHRAIETWSVTALILQMLVVGAVSNAVREAVGDVGPSSAEFYRIAFGGDPSVPPWTMRATPDGTQLLIEGGFKYGLTRAFVGEARSLPSLRTVHLSSGGGRLGEALHLAREIRARGLDTVVSDICASACTLAFAAGRQRWLLPPGALGYHGESFLGVGLADHGGDDGEGHALTEAGLPAAFVAKAVAVPPGRLWKPSVAELLEAKAITGVAPADRFAASSVDPGPTKSSPSVAPAKAD